MSSKLSVQKLIHDTRGAGFVEYIILVGVVALFCIAGYKYFGDKVTDKIKAQGDAVTGVNSTAP
jgi:pilus assembly protein Flp/PilA